MCLRIPYRPLLLNQLVEFEKSALQQLRVTTVLHCEKQGRQLRDAYLHRLGKP